MSSSILKIYEKIFVIIFLFIFVNVAYIDTSSPPSPGDNWDYHIPIARNILSGNIINPVNYKLDKWYYPGASEAYLSVLQVLGLSLNYSNLIALVFFLFLTRKVGIIYGLDSKVATIYAVTLCSLPTIYFRLITSESIDLWLINYILGIVLLLKSPKNTIGYFAMLGFLFGMLIGTKYSGLLYAIFLLLFYIKNFIKYFSFKRFLIFSLFVLVLGFSWYIRNYLVIGDPFFPEASKLFPHTRHTNLSVLDYQGWRVLLFVHNGAKMMLDALLSETKMWAFSLLVIPFIFFKSGIKKPIIREIIYLGLFGLFVFLISPSSSAYDPLVSSLRYSYPLFAFFVLSIFIFISTSKKLEYLIILSFANILLFAPITYHAKIIFIVLPLVVVYELLSSNTTLANIPIIKKSLIFFKHYAL